MYVDHGFLRQDVFSLDSLIAWLEKMPNDGAYDYWCTDGSCLYGQYTHSHGIPWRECGHFERAGERAEFCDFVYEEIACEKPYTFGAALERARALSRTPQETEGAKNG